MTNILYLTIILTFFSCNGQITNSSKSAVTNSRNHNKIDDINSAREIENILKPMGNEFNAFKVDGSLRFKDFKGQADKECQHISDSLEIKPWTKADFDGNGYTDLLVVGNWYSQYSIICILDSGENKFFIKRITRGISYDCIFPIAKMIDTMPSILYYSRTEVTLGNYKTPRSLKLDTLIFLFGDFIEFSNTPANHKIEKIDYSAGACFGTCPIFKLIINSDRTATYNALHYNKQEGSFSSTIDTTNFNLLINLLNYIDFVKLDNHYAVSWTDDQGCVLKITYDNGQTKEIDDYGLIGTFGLSRTYDLLFKLRENQEWK